MTEVNKKKHLDVTQSNWQNIGKLKPVELFGKTHKTMCKEKKGTTQYGGGAIKVWGCFAASRTG